MARSAHLRRRRRQHQAKHKRRKKHPRKRYIHRQVRVSHPGHAGVANGRGFTAAPSAPSRRCRFHLQFLPPPRARPLLLRWTAVGSATPLATFAGLHATTARHSSRRTGPMRKKAAAGFAPIFQHCAHPNVVHRGSLNRPSDRDLQPIFVLRFIAVLQLPLPSGQYDQQSTRSAAVIINLYKGLLEQSKNISYRFLLGSQSAGYREARETLACFRPRPRVRR